MSTVFVNRRKSLSEKEVLVIILNSDSDLNSNTYNSSTESDVSECVSEDIRKGSSVE